MAGSRVVWYGDKVEARLQDATRDLIDKLAFRIVGRTVVNIVANDQVDTAFMKNSVYAVTPKSNNYAEALAAAAARNPKAQMGPKIDPRNDDSAIVAVGAAYAVYNELRKSFLFKAAEESAHEMSGLVEQVARENRLR